MIPIGIDDRSAYSTSDGEAVEEAEEDDDEVSKDHSEGGSSSGISMMDRARFIPLRLTGAERILLAVIEGALSVSEYTDNVDVSTNNYYARQAYDKTETIISELEDLCQIILGLGICNDYKTTGVKLVYNKEISDNEDFLQQCMEVGRRYKLMNPDKMRSTYGKLLYVLMDAASPKIRHGVKYTLDRKTVTVYSLLELAGALELLKDPNLIVATSPIETNREDPSQSELQKKEREKAIEDLVLKYSSKKDEVSSFSISQFPPTCTYRVKKRICHQKM